MWFFEKKRQASGFGARSAPIPDAGTCRGLILKGPSLPRFCGINAGSRSVFQK